MGGWDAVSAANVDGRHVVVKKIVQARVKVWNVEVRALADLADLAVMAAEVLHVGVVVVGTCLLHYFHWIRCRNR